MTPLVTDPRPLEPMCARPPSPVLHLPTLRRWLASLETALHELDSSAIDDPHTIAAGKIKDIEIYRTVVGGTTMYQG